MIVVTGAAGFIASAFIGFLNEKGVDNLVLVDDFSISKKDANLQYKRYLEKVERNVFCEWLSKHNSKIDFVFHLGARTDTAEFDQEIFDRLNLNYSKNIWTLCAQHQIPLVYASSAATYGMGEQGYDDKHSLIAKLKPLNPYGESKNNFDIWALQQKERPPLWVGFKFFNVFGPNEFHKGRMASVVFHAFNQITSTSKMKLFRSHNPEFRDGEQMRDFIYVKDLARVLIFALNNTIKNGIYNLGTGKARTFLDLVNATFNALAKEPSIGFIDTPVDIRDKYQYFTQANMNKLIDQGYNVPFTSLEESVADYVQNYLLKNKYL
ncbi:MAG: ADP-glyceromanno-heptose 6-epimerase [Flavobacteriales bacterium]